MANMTQVSENRVGKVYLVGAGPGDPRLITVRGTECLAEADLVLYDYLVNPQLLQYVPAAAERVCLGHPHGGREMLQQEINRRMVEAAQAGKTVVRLKSGDPCLFGRGAEEVEVLTAAGIPYEVVPGVTAAFAVASHAGIPLTHRDLASAVALITGHRRGDKAGPELDYGRFAQFPGTLVFYMGMTSSRQWSEALLARRPVARHPGGHRAPRELAGPGDRPLHVGNRGRRDRRAEALPAGSYCRR